VSNVSSSEYSGRPCCAAVMQGFAEGLGMSSMDAILTTTRNAARALKMDRDIGTIEEGKLADVIAVDGDPLADIRILQERKRIQMVMKEGDIFVDRRPGKSREVVHAEPDSWKIVDA
jgi:imidazolonepropionase-like amidohydrolase